MCASTPAQEWVSEPSDRRLSSLVWRAFVWLIFFFFWLNATALMPPSLFERQTFSQETLAPTIKDKIERNETHVVVTVAVPSDPRKQPEKPGAKIR
jgi:hypothetical protein